MDVRLQDGTVVKNVPDGITQTELTARVERMRGLKQEGVKHSAPPQFVPSGEKAENPLLDASGPLGSATPGAAMFGRGLMDLAQGVVQPFAGDDYTKAKTNDYKQYGKDFQEAGGGFDPARLAGNLAPTVALPIGAPGGMVKQMGTNAAIGGATGAAMFAPEGQSKIANAAGGAALGAVLPPVLGLAAKTGKTVYHGLIEPWAAPAAIKGRAYLEAAGDKADQIIEHLTRNKQIVPGSLPTAGEAASPAGRAEFSALQESAARAEPSKYLARSDAQNAARIGAVQEFAGNPAKVAEASAARDAKAKPLYDEGTSGTLPRPSETANVTDFQALAARKSTQAAIKRAESLIQEETGKAPNLDAQVRSGRITGDSAQKIKLAFDDLIHTYPKSAADTAELDAIKDSRTAYINWMESNFPKLKEARAVYKEESAPINQMEVGTELEKRLTPALRDDAKLRSGSFAAAVRESASTIKKATGEPRFQELEDVLTGRQLQSVHGVQDDLARADRHLDMARRGSQAAPDAISLATGNLEREVGGKMPNLLNRHVMLMNAVIGRLEGRVNRKLASEMATEMLDPPKVGESIAAAKAREIRNQAVAEALLKAQRPAVAGGAIGLANQGE